MTADMDVENIEWVDPPPATEKSPYDAFAAKLKERPGDWAILSRNRKSPHTLASNIKKGRYKAFRPAGAYDALSREGVVYACYLGATDEERQAIADAATAVTTAALGE